MGTIVRQSSFGLVTNYFGVVLGFINVMLIMPFILRAEEIGLVNLIFSVVMIVYPILDFSASPIIGRYFPAVQNKQEILHLGFLITCVGAAVFFFIFLLGQPLFEKYYSENSPEILPYFWWIFGISIIMSWSSLIENFSVINGKYHVSSFFRDVFFRLGITLILMALHFQLINFNTYVFLYFSLYGIAGVGLLIYLIQRGLFKFEFSLPQLSYGKKKSMFRFGSFTIFTGLATMIAMRIDMVMLGSMEGLKDVGIYTIAMFMATTIEIPRRTVQQSSAPIIRMAFRDKNIDQVAQIQYKTILNLLIVGCFVLTALMVNLHDMYRIIPNGEVYQHGFFVVLLLGLTKLVEILGGSNDEIILSSRYYALNIVYIFILTSLSICLNYVMIPQYGIYGAAMATLFAVSIVTIIKSIAFKLLFKRSVYKLSFLGILLFYLSLGLVLYYFDLPSHPIFSIIIKTGILGLMVFFFLKWTKISPDLNELIRQILKYVRLDKWITI